MKQLKDTVRVIEWEELPARAREIPASFDPLAEGVLMKHQVEWSQFWRRFKLAVCPKGRRTGITFDTGLDMATVVASRRSAGGDNVFYIGDTKEKGLEFIGYMAHMLRIMAEAQGAGVSGIEEFIFEDQDEDGRTKHISAYRIRTAAGFQAVALSSRPANIRGLQGIVVIDEAAFHADVQGVLDAATALLIWGGRILVISSHNGKANPFNQLIKDIENGIYGEQASVYKVTFDDAVANGLYERVCMMKGEAPTAEGKRGWYEMIRKAYGPRKAAMREELDAIPRDGKGVVLPGVWIENAMTEYRPILRLVCDDDFALMPEGERMSWGEAWIAKHLEPMFEAIDPMSDYVFGMDYARHRHFSVIMPAEITPALKRKVPFIVELSNVPTRQQEQILWAMIDGLIKFGRFFGGGIDATGPGQTIAEYTADRYGEGIHQIDLSRKWYSEWMPRFTDSFQDGMIDLPIDRSLEGDMRAIEEIDGIQMIPKLERKDLKDPELVRHGDGAIAGALMWYASLNKAGLIEYRGIGRANMTGSGRRNDFMRPDHSGDHQRSSGRFGRGAF